MKLTNHQSYLNEMRMSVYDKLFFLQFLQEPCLIVDYGCADGSVIQAAKKLAPDNFYIGYDHVNPLSRYDFTFTTSLEKLNDLVKKNPFKKKALVLNSVLHEICHYGSHDEVDDFRDWVDNQKFDYIFIRDMYLSDPRPPTMDQYHNLITKCDVQQWKEHCENYKESLTEQFYQFLLKYRFEINWSREVKEDYFAAQNYIIGWIREIAGSDLYDLLHVDKFNVPYIKNKVKEDFDIDLISTTHIKLAIKRRS